MSKAKINRKVAKVATRVDPRLVALRSAFVDALADIRGIVNAFWVVANAATQTFQNESPAMTRGTLKVKGIASAFAFEYPAKFNPAFDPEKPMDRGKHAARPFLNYAAARAFPSDATRVLEVLASMLVWSARKVVKSRTDSKEGALMMQILNRLESSGVTIESLEVGEEHYTRDAIMARGANLIRSLEVRREAGVLEVKRNPKRGAIKDGVTL
jgi:hypothetical protein